MTAQTLKLGLKSLALACLGVVCLSLSTISPAKADALRYLPRGDQALMQMAELIRSAKVSIDLTYYIFDPCGASTKTLINLLEQKAREGVKVRMLLDAFTHDKDLQQKLRQSLLKSGIDLRYFNRMRISTRVNYRTHAKILIADGQRYITGGRNIADDYFGLNGENFIDRDVYVEGPSAGSVQAKFNMFWGKNLVYVPGPSSFDRVDDLEKNCFKVDEKTEGLREAIEKESLKTLQNSPVVQCEDIKFTLDDPKFWHSTPDQQTDPTSRSELLLREERLEKKETTKELLTFLNESTDNLVMENWSYIPTLSVHWALRSLRTQNVPILVVTNRTTDVGGSVDILNKKFSTRDNFGSQRVLGMSNRGSMEGTWSQTPKDAKWMIHSKVYVANMKHAAVTSFNLDPRSYHTNIETGLFVRNCPAFAEQVMKETTKMLESFEKDKSCEVCKHVPDVSIGAKIQAFLTQELM